MFQDGILSARAVERPQLGHGLTAIGDHERPALADLLQLPAKPGLQFADANGSTSSHVVMLSTSDAAVNHA